MPKTNRMANMMKGRFSVVVLRVVLLLILFRLKFVPCKDVPAGAICVCGATVLIVVNESLCLFK